MKLDDESQAQLIRRQNVGEQCIDIAFGGAVRDEERETYARDAVSDILTALFGPAGISVPTKAEDHVATDWREAPQITAQETAKTFLDMAFDSWLGDAEDYTAEPSDALTW